MKKGQILSSGINLILIIFIGMATLSCATLEDKNISRPEKGTNGGLMEYRSSEEIQLDYIITIPEGYSDISSEGYPFIVFLHSVQERGNELSRLIENPEGEGYGLAYYASEIDDFPFITLSPQCPCSTFWPFISGRVKRLIDEVTDTYNIDPKRIYITGVSMGGIGTWDMIMKYPDLFAASAPIAGGVYPMLMNNSYKRILELPVWAFHDLYDPSLKIKDEINFIMKLNNAGGNIKYTITQKGIHYIQPAIYSGQELYDWFLAAEKP